MLSLPPKLQEAFDRGNFEPVIYAEIQTKILDQASEAAPVFQAIQGSLNIPANKKNVEIAYPDVSATATQAALLPNLNGGESGLGYMDGRVLSYFQWQTFILGEDVQQAKRLKNISTKLRYFNYRQTGIAPLSAGQWRLKSRIYETINGLPSSEIGTAFRYDHFISTLRGRTIEGVVSNENATFSNGGSRQGAIFTTLSFLDTGYSAESSTIIDPANIGSSFADYNWPFDVDLIPGRQYAIVLMLEELVGGTIKLFKIGWKAADQKQGESSGSGWGVGPFLLLIFRPIKLLLSPFYKFNLIWEGRLLMAGDGISLTIRSSFLIRFQSCWKKRRSPITHGPGIRWAQRPLI